MTGRGGDGMGMESYFFSLTMDTVCTKENLFDWFAAHYPVRSYCVIRRDRRKPDAHRPFSVANKAALEFMPSAEGIVIRFEVCFSNYMNNMMFLYEMLCGLERFGKITLALGSQSRRFDGLGFEEFARLMRDSHAAKLKQFTRQYGEDLRQDFLPNGDFYRAMARKSFLKGEIP